MIIYILYKTEKKLILNTRIITFMHGNISNMAMRKTKTIRDFNVKQFVEYYNFLVAINLQVKKKCDNPVGQQVFTQNYIQQNLPRIISFLNFMAVA